MKTYRPCVGIALLNKENQLFIGKRIYHDNPGIIKPWQMPQGGIDKHEHPLTAAIRELYEETGITKISYLYRYDGLQYYDFPPELNLQSRMQNFLGQAQQWFFFRYHGDEEELERHFAKVAEKEFETWRFASTEEVLAAIVHFKAALYARVLSVMAYL